MLTYELAQKLLHYNPDTGKFRWRVRSPEDFPSWKPGVIKAFNNTFAGRHALNSIKHGYNGGYLRGQVIGRVYRAHRVAWLMINGEWPEFEIDHINGAKDDNRIVNLRDIPHRENMLNNSHILKRRPLSSGVFWNKKEKVWRVRCGANYIGCSRSYEEALLLRFEAIHGPVSDKEKMLSIIMDYSK